MISNAQKEFTFECGEMIIKDKKAQANPDKGEITFYTNPEGLLCMRWKNKTQNKLNEPLVICPGDFVWKKIPSQKGRVYLLQHSIYNDDKYYYNNDILLNDVVFYLYAKEDIYENGKLIYSKDDKVNECTTNDGKCKIENIPLGNYYLKEISSSEGNVLDNTEYNISFSYKIKLE